MNMREANFRPDTTDTLYELTQNFQLGLALLEGGREDITSRIEYFVCDSKISVDIRHRLSDVKLASVKLKLEVGAEFFHEQLHLHWVFELGMVAGKLRITHDALHEVFHEETHFGVASELVVKRLFLFLYFQVNLYLSSRSSGCSYRHTTKRTLSLARPTVDRALIATILIPVS
jgi:hypothetical protein